MNVFGNVNQVYNLAQQEQEQNKCKISVKGWQNATRQDFLNFVSRKTRIAIQNSYVEGNLIIGFVNKQDVDSLLKFNGIRFAGNSLKFERLDEQQVSGTSNTISLLKGFILKRYNASSKMLDLSGLYQDAELLQNGLFSSMSTQSKMFPALMKLASSDNQLIIESINLSNNNLKDINGISSLAQAFPRLKNLCLANNQISKFHSLEIWKHKFKMLNELLMLNNPIINDRLYRSEMLRLFPKLTILDNVLVRNEHKLKEIFSLPMHQQQFFFEENSLGQSSTDFVSNFLNLWDTNRSQLMGLYTSQSQFSVSVDSSVPASSVLNSDQNPTFGYYLPLSRNMTKVSSEKTKQQRLAVGQEQITELFQSLPTSKHYLQEQSVNYSLQAWSYPQLNGFTITLHGHFKETGKPQIDTLSRTSNSSTNRHRRYNHSFSSTNNNKLSKKSFDRTWVIVPTQGSIIIASDMLIIRPYADGSWSAYIEQQSASSTSTSSSLPSSSTVEPLSTQQFTSQPSLQLPADITSKLNHMQLELIQKLHVQTKLNAQYTCMLAEQSGWNYEVAIKGFQNNMNSIPREAFIL